MKTVQCRYGKSDNSLAYTFLVEEELYEKLIYGDFLLVPTKGNCGYTIVRVVDLLDEKHNLNINQKQAIGKINLET